MAQNPQLQVQVRTEKGKGPAKRLRHAGRVPCVMYGSDTDPISLSADAGEIEEIAYHSGIVELTFDDDHADQPVLAREIQRHFLNGNVQHADFLAVDMNVKITSSIPLTPLGEPIGLQHGGMLDQLAFEIEVECLPSDIPEEITHDVSGLDLGDTVLITDIILPEGVEAVYTDAETAVFSVTLAMTEEEEEEDSDDEAVEPELIGEDSDEESEDSAEEEASE